MPAVELTRCQYDNEYSRSMWFGVKDTEQHFREQGSCMCSSSSNSKEEGEATHQRNGKILRINLMRNVCDPYKDNHKILLVK